MDFRNAARGALLLALLAAGALPLRAQPASFDSVGSGSTALSLPDLLRLADGTPAVQAARLGADAQARAADAAGAWPDPSVSLMAFPEPLVTARGAQRTQWRAEQRVPWPGTRGLQTAAARAGAAQTAAMADVFALDLALQVQQIYFDGARAVRLLQLLQPFRERLDAFADAAALRYAAGRGPQVAVLQIGLERTRLRERELQLQADTADARLALAQLLDRPALQVEFGLDDAAPLLPTPGFILPAQPERAALDAADARTAADIALAEKAFYPGLAVALTYFDLAERSAPPTADGSDAFAVSLSATIPLDRAARRSALASARLRQQQLAAQRGALDARLQADADRARLQADTDAQAVTLYRDQLVPQAGAAVESALAAYAAGDAPFLLVLDAERARFDVLTGLETARSRLLVAQARLGRALGLLP